MPDAGWYRDPQDQSVEEYWDGQNWSGQRRPSSTPQGYDQPARDVWGQRPAHLHQQYAGQPSYGVPPGYAAAPGYAAQPGYAPPGWTPGAEPKRRRRRKPFVIAGIAVVVLVAAGSTAFVLRPTSSPAITYHGKQITAADTLLAKVGKAVDAHVARDHGARSSDTRCYFEQPRKPAKGAKSSDVDDSLTCGPVLFFDGTPSDQYLTVPLSVASGSGSAVRLSADTSFLTGATPGAVSKGLRLVRPDGEVPPSGNGGLSLPTPPVAPKNALVAAVLRTDQPTVLDHATMTGREQSVTLRAAGTVSSYGDGADARSAPAGQRLIAFQITLGEGALGSAGGVAPVLVVDGSARSIPPASGATWDVAAVPTGSTPVIRLSTAGFSQTLSLPGGKPGPQNIAVLNRTNTFGLISRDFAMRSTLSKGGASEVDKISVTVDSANLYFWPPIHPKDHPSAPGSGYLSIGLSYKKPGETKIYGFDPGLLHLQIAGGGSVRAHNLAGAGHIYDVFTVPAGFTRGTLVIGGSTKLDDGVHQRLKETERIPVEIPAD